MCRNRTLKSRKIISINNVYDTAAAKRKSYDILAKSEREKEGERQREQINKTSFQLQII